MSLRTLSASTLILSPLKTARFLFGGIAVAIVITSCSPAEPEKNEAEKQASSAAEASSEMQKTTVDTTTSKPTSAETFPEPKSTTPPVTSGTSVLPQGWPDDAPIFPGATITNALSEKTGMVVFYTTSESADAVFNFYKRELAARGWTFELIVNPAGYVAGYSGLGGKDRRVISVAIRLDKGQTSVRVGVGDAESAFNPKANR